VGVSGFRPSPQVYSHTLPYRSPLQSAASNTFSLIRSPAILPDSSARPNVFTCLVADFGRSRVPACLQWLAWVSFSQPAQGPLSPASKRGEAGPHSNVALVSCPSIWLALWLIAIVGREGAASAWTARVGLGYSPLVCSLPKRLSRYTLFTGRGWPGCPWSR